MNFDMQTFVGSALMGVGQRYSKNYDAYKKEQMDIAAEQRRYQTDLMKEQELYTRSTARKAQQEQDAIASLMDQGWSQQEATLRVKHGGAETRDQAFDRRMQEETDIARAKQGIAAEGRSAVQEENQANFEAWLQKNPDVVPGTEQYHNAAQGFGVVTGGMSAEDKATAAARAKHAASTSMVREFWPDLEPGSKQFESKVRTVANIEAKANTMSDEQQRLWVKDANDHADRLEETMGEGQLITKYGDNYREAIVEEYLSQSDIGKYQADSPGPTKSDVEKLADQPEEVQKQAIAKVEEKYGKPAAQEFAQELEEEKEALQISGQYDASSEHKGQTALKGVTREDPLGRGRPKPQPMKKIKRDIDRLKSFWNTVTKWGKGRGQAPEGMQEYRPTE